MDISKIKPLTPEAIKNITSITSPDKININSSGSGYGAIPSLTTMSGPVYTYSATPNVVLAGGTATNAIWTTTSTGTGGTTMPTYTLGTGLSSGTMVDHGGKIKLQGDGADVDINGKSLKTWMEKVEERLNILTPNSELEKDWDDLRRLGERYRKLEKKCQEKAEVWRKLKSMPKVEIK